MLELSWDQVRALIAEDDRPCLSIYLPTHRTAPQFQEDRIRLKNLGRTAEERLVASGLRPPTARDLLEPARALVDDSLFWRRQSDGLAIFRSPRTFRHYRVPSRFAELVVLGERFQITPLLPVLAADGEFYILALSQKEVRLIRASRHGAAEVPLESVPRSLADALRYDVFEKQLQLHTRSASGSGGARPAMVRHGVGWDDDKANLLRFFQGIDRGLREVMGWGPTPLVLAGVDYLHSIYREANSYPALLPEGIAGNPENESPAALRQKAWPLVQPRFNRAREDDAASYRTLAGTGRTSRELAEVLPAARGGRVAVLFVADGRQVWGRFQEEKDAVELHRAAEPRDEDLLNLAAIEVIRKAGTVHALPPEEMPEAGPVAAIYRY